VDQKDSIDISIRDIANEAKVNVAAINYHLKQKTL
jgi:AcrR family transcriptional regulator